MLTKDFVKSVAEHTPETFSIDDLIERSFL